MDYDTIVIGAGPAGLMAGGQASKLSEKVAILEKNAKPGEKLSMTGGGRCNITNAEFDIRKFVANYGDAEQYLYSPFSKFDVKSTFSFFEKHGLPLVVEARKRVFPQTQKAKDVTATMINFAQDSGAEILTNTEVKRFVVEEGKIIAIETSAGRMHAKRYILATGGLSGKGMFKKQGMGFKMLKELGHTVQDPTPGLVPLRSDAKWVQHLSGLSLSFMTIRFKQNGKTKIKKTGKLLFTHFGLSGPLIINSSYEVKKLLERGPVMAIVDLYPDTDHKALDQRLIKLFNKNKNKQLRNVLNEIMEKSLVIEILGLVSISLEEKVNSITKDERKKLVHTLKELAIPIDGLMGIEWAIVADGGVALDEINFKTMQSKLFDNLYIIGDLLNVNRPSGGFSLQLCWTTGFVAGTSA